MNYTVRMENARAKTDHLDELETHADGHWESVEFTALSDAALEALSDVVVDCSRDGKILRASRNFADLSGLPVQKINGQACEQFEFLRGNDIPNCTKKIIKADGSEVWLERYQFSMRQHESGEVFIRVVGRDVSQHKRTEAALIEARRQAEEADAAKSRFLAMVSHEIRTPLNGITGMGRLLADTQLSDEQRNYAESMISSSEALLLLVNDLLQFGREDIVADRIKPEPTFIAPLIAGVVELLAEKAHKKDIDLGYDLSADLPEKLNIDAGRLRQILFNIIGNAIKFTAKGGVRIDVSFHDAQLHIRVEDTGPGIAPEHQENVFMPFEQVENTFNRTHDGAGLGLAIARKMARAMGGDIEVDSAIGEGSVFTVLVNATSLIDAPETLPVNETIMVCMRNGFEADLLCDVAARAGANVLYYSNLEELRQHASQQPYPSKIIIDQRLAKNDPSKQFELSTHDNCQIIALITPEQRGTIGAAFKAAGHGFLTRPVRPSTARRVLANDIPMAVQPMTEKVTSAKSSGAINCKILLAEDNPINALLAINLLETASCAVTHVTDGAQAVELLDDNHDFDAVLMDLHMPVMDGLTAIKAIRRNEEERNAFPVPVLAVTADNQHETNKSIMAAGASGILEKPLNIDALSTFLNARKRSAS